MDPYTNCKAEMDKITYKFIGNPAPTKPVKAYKSLPFAITPCIEYDEKGNIVDDDATEIKEALVTLTEQVQTVKKLVTDWE